jgi:hypothetical protein
LYSLNWPYLSKISFVVEWFNYHHQIETLSFFFCLLVAKDKSPPTFSRNDNMVWTLKTCDQSYFLFLTQSSFLWPYHSIPILSIIINKGIQFCTRILYIYIWIIFFIPHKSSHNKKRKRKRKRKDQNNRQKFRLFPILW